MFVYRLHEENTQPVLQAGVAVRSKQFRKSVDRNRIKRMIREAYRLQKRPLREQVAGGKKSLDLFIIYTGQELPSYAELLVKTGDALHKILERYEAEQ